MSNRKRKWWLAIVVMCCLAPATFADRGHRRVCDAVDESGDRNCRKVEVPEGGSTAIYLLGAGLTCVGAMFLRSRITKPAQS
jgi:hypothetical protein